MLEHALCCAVQGKASDVQDGFHRKPELMFKCAQYLGGLSQLVHTPVSQPGEQCIMMAVITEMLTDLKSWLCGPGEGI